MSAGQNAVTTWLHAATPGILLVAPQFVRGTVIALALASVMSAWANTPPWTITTTTADQLLPSDAQAAYQRIRLVIKLDDFQHVGTGHDSLPIRRE